QLPPRWNVDVDRLATFFAALPPRRLHAIEFRDPSWYTDEVFALIRRHRVALCLHDMPGSATGFQSVGPFVYVRFHGAQGNYAGEYGDDSLEQWASWLAEQVDAGKAVFAYFNNDLQTHAPRDAVR